MIRRLLYLSLAVVFVLLLLLLVLATSGCYECKSGTMRCHQNKVQLCAPNHRWKTVVDCSQLKRTKNQHACVRLSNDRCSCRVKQERP